MKKNTLKSYLIIVLLFVINTLHAQSPEWSWVNQTTDSKVFPISMEVDSEGNSIVAGYYQGSSITMGNTVLEGGVGSHHFFLAKYNTEGSLLWAKTAVGADSDILSVTIDSENNIYATGYTNDDFTIDDAIIETSPELINVFILKFNPEGTALFGKVISHSGIGIVDIAVNNNGVYLTGSFSNEALIVDNVSLPYEDYMMSMYVLKCTKEDGEVIWGNKTPSSGTITGQSLATDGEGNLYLSGIYVGQSLVRVTDDTEEEETAPEDIILESQGANDTMLIKFDSDDEIIWAQSIGDNYSDIIRNISTDSEGNVYGAVWHIGANFNQSYVFKYNAEGELQWQKDISGEGNLRSITATADKQGNLYVSGFSNSETFSIGDSQQEIDTPVIYICKLNTEGSLEWIKTSETANTENNSPRSVSIDPANNIYIYGSFISYINIGENSLDSTYFDFFLTKLGNEPLMSNEDFLAEKNIIYPNPASTILYLSIDSIDRKFEIVDLTGRIVKTGVLIDNSINISNLPTGMYSLKVNGISTKFIKE